MPPFGRIDLTHAAPSKAVPLIPGMGLWSGETHELDELEVKSFRIVGAGCLVVAASGIQVAGFTAGKGTQE